jgi:hypothetical protein
MPVVLEHLVGNAPPEAVSGSVEIIKHGKQRNAENKKFLPVNIDLIFSNPNETYKQQDPAFLAPAPYGTDPPYEKNGQNHSKQVPIQLLEQGRHLIFLQKTPPINRQLVLSLHALTQYNKKTLSMLKNFLKKRFAAREGAIPASDYRPS